MIQSTKELIFNYDLRDKIRQNGIVQIKIISFTRNIALNLYEIQLQDSVQGVIIKDKIIHRTYDEVDTLRAMVLSQKTYQTTGSKMEDELLIDVALMIVQQEAHYWREIGVDTLPEDWELVTETQI